MGTARELYTAETFWAGYYNLYEINEEIFSKLKTKGMERRDAHELINTGRHLYKSVSDRNGSYDVALDENYASREISYDEFRSFFPTLTGCFSGGATFAADTGESGIGSGTAAGLFTKAFYICLVENRIITKAAFLCGFFCAHSPLQQLFCQYKPFGSDVCTGGSSCCCPEQP